MKTIVLLIVILKLIAITLSGYVAPLYAEWAHHHVVWINGR